MKCRIDDGDIGLGTHPCTSLAKGVVIQKKRTRPAKVKHIDHEPPLWPRPVPLSIDPMNPLSGRKVVETFFSRFEERCGPLPGRPRRPNSINHHKGSATARICSGGKNNQPSLPAREIHVPAARANGQASMAHDAARKLPRHSQPGSGLPLRNRRSAESTIDGAASRHTSPHTHISEK